MAVPATPGPITGTFAPNSTFNLSISAVLGATGYFWTVPAGWTINSGQGTTTINVTSDNCGGSVTVYAFNGDGNSATYSQYVGMVMTIVTTPISCVDGTATATFSGGTGPYTIFWQDPNFNFTDPAVSPVQISVDVPGTYFAILQDANLCELEVPYTIEESDPIEATFSFDCDLLELTANVTGGSGDFSYSWDPGGGTTATIEVTLNTLYTLTVTDNESGCSEIFNYTTPADCTIQTRMGEEIEKDGVLFVESLSVPTSPTFCDIPNCPFALNVYADPDDYTNKFNNDKSEFLFYGNPSITAIAIKLQKLENGSWVNKATITNNTYGDFFAFGKALDFSGNDFIDDFNKKYTGVFLKWSAVHSAFGIGRYRIQVTYTDILGDNTIQYSKVEYCLNLWNCYATDGTIKIETINEGLRGTLNDKTVQIDYYTGWSGEIRLRGMFKQLNPTYTKEFNQYGDADFNVFKPIINEQIPKYKLQIKNVPGFIDWYVSTNILQADQTLITDFNSLNRHPLVEVPVINDGDMEVLNETYVNPLASIELKLSYGFNNLRKRNS